MCIRDSHLSIRTISSNGKLWNTTGRNTSLNPIPFQTDTRKGSSGSSRMTGNCQVRFLEDGTRVISFCYSTNDEDEKHHIYITNIQKDVLNAKDIAKLYGARWDIELLFKELKSRYALDVLETKNVQIIEAFIWTSMLTLIVSRRIYSLVKNSTANPKKMARYTQSRWSKIFAQKAADLLTVILHRCGIQRTFETTMSVYKSQALDPHVNRKRFREEWFE